MPAEFKAFFAALSPRAFCIRCLSRFYEVDTPTIAVYLGTLGSDVVSKHDGCDNCRDETETFTLRRAS